MSWCVDKNGTRRKSQERLKSDLGSQLFGKKNNKLHLGVKLVKYGNQMNHIYQCLISARLD